MTRSQLRKVIQRSELTAGLLRLRGCHSLGHGQRCQIADDLETLTSIARRAFDTETLDIRPLVCDATADEDAREADLFGGAA